MPYSLALEFAEFVQERGKRRPAERRFTVGGSGKSVVRCHRTVLAYWKFESISLQQRESANFRSLSSLALTAHGSCCRRIRQKIVSLLADLHG